MNEPVIVQLVGDATMLEKLLQTMLEDHFCKAPGCVRPACWVSSYDFASMQLGFVFGPNAIFSIVN